MTRKIKALGSKLGAGWDGRDVSQTSATDRGNMPGLSDSPISGTFGFSSC